MVFNYFYTIVILVSVLLFLNIVNRILFMRFVNSLPGTKKSDLQINDLLDRQKFEKFIRNLDPKLQSKATKTRTWLIRTIVSMFIVILLIVFVGVLLFLR